MALKGNQGNLLDDVTEAFHETLCKSKEWKGLQILIQIESERYHKNTGKTQKKVRYYNSRLSGDASLHNKAIREHWGIENKLHWTLDVVLGEDQSQKRAGNAAQNFSIITCIALNLLKKYKTKKVSQYEE